MKKAVLIFGWLSFGPIYFAQQAFTIKEGSSFYDANITVAQCDSDHCEGKGTIKLNDKNSGKLVQELTSEDLYFFLTGDQKPTVNVVQLYNEQSPLIFDDFNFDGTEDLAIRNGNNSSYGGPSYDVYVYNLTKKKLVFSEELSNLVLENLGMFQVDRDRKRLITFAKSGCCWHLTTEYEIIPKKGLSAVYTLEEDATGGYNVTVTESHLINQKWNKKVKTYKYDDYYKE